MSMSPDRILLYCRAGFESECAQEVMDHATENGCGGYIRAHKNAAYVEWVETVPGHAKELYQSVRFEQLIFARQWFLSLPMMEDLPETDRVTPLLAAFRSLNVRLGHLWVESPDTNQGKELATFCKKFTAPLAQRLRQQELLSKSQNPGRAWGHAFFLDSRRVFVGYSTPNNRSIHQNGIMRLKFPHDAPSRSTLKLDEAFLTLLTEEEREQRIRLSDKAVDLGAAPGGWTWQLVRRGLFVTAVDNGPMDAALLETGQVVHKREDGFRFQPKQPVAWMVCDMVEKPHRVADLIGDWLVKGLCRQTIFNLKLPMKRRYEDLQSCLHRIQRRMEAAGLDYVIRARQLYHDREEVTVYIGIC